MEYKICVVGLGYVGLPLAVELSKYFKVVGFDINGRKIELLKKNIDPSNELSEEEIRNCNVSFTKEESEIKNCNFIIACVPTPIDNNKKPDLKYLENVSSLIGKNLSKDSIVVYESTVFPGVTEDICGPILEKESNLKLGVDFKIGYSPERINPGDKKHTIDKIIKIVAGMDDDSLEKINFVYNKITSTHKASSIKVAESAKVIENIQRDLNIALMNELKIIFDKMDINTKEVLEAAGTKWNFHKYSPGLVGGHCIGVDPYYLTHKAESLGHHPEVILAGRRINDNMHKYFAEKIIKDMIKNEINIKNAKILILGLTFKPNVSDYRNSRVKNLIEELKTYGLDVYGYDPHLDEEIIKSNFNVKYNSELNNFDYKIIAVKHKEFQELIDKVDFVI